MPRLDLSPDEQKACAKMLAESMPEYRALQERLLAESTNARRAVANLFHDWAFHPTTGMSVKELEASLAALKAELARRGEPVD
jgi:hypothetical protein